MNTTPITINEWINYRKILATTAPGIAQRDFDRLISSGRYFAAIELLQECGISI